MVDLEKITFLREPGPDGHVRIRAVVHLESAVEYDPLHEAKKGNLPTDDDIKRRLVAGLWQAVYGEFYTIAQFIPPQAVRLHLMLRDLLLPNLEKTKSIEDRPKPQDETK